MRIARFEGALTVSAGAKEQWHEQKKRNYKTETIKENFFLFLSSIFLFVYNNGAVD